MEDIGCSKNGSKVRSAHCDAVKQWARSPGVDPVLEGIQQALSIIIQACPCSHRCHMCTGTCKNQ